eukprot:s2739_g4.t1
MGSKTWIAGSSGCGGTLASVGRKPGPTRWRILVLMELRWANQISLVDFPWPHLISAEESTLNWMMKGRFCRNTLIFLVILVVEQAVVLPVNIPINQSTDLSPAYIVTADSTTALILCAFGAARKKVRSEIVVMSRTRVLAIVVLAALCRGDCSSDTTESCTGAEDDWLGSMLPPGFSPHSSFVKCIGATLAGSVFALVGMVIEGRKERRQEKPISREELKLPRSSPRAMSPRLEKVNSPPGEVEGSTSPLPSREGEMKRSQSMPSAQLKRAGSQEWKDTPKARSDEMNWRSTNGRLPRTISAPVPQKVAGKSLSEMQQVERQVKSILNKLTWEKFDKLYTDLLTYCIVDDERLRLETLEVIARDVFKKATWQTEGLLAALEFQFRKMAFSTVEPWAKCT